MPFNVKLLFLSTGQLSNLHPWTMTLHSGFAKVFTPFSFYFFHVISPNLRCLFLWTFQSSSNKMEGFSKLFLILFYFLVTRAMASLELKGSEWFYYTLSLSDFHHFWFCTDSHTRLNTCSSNTENNTCTVFYTKRWSAPNMGWRKCRRALGSPASRPPALLLGCPHLEAPGRPGARVGWRRVSGSPESGAPALFPGGYRAIQLFYTATANLPSVLCCSCYLNCSSREILL